MKDLTNGTFTISSLDHTNVSRFYPIIHPGQSAVLAIPKVIDSFCLDKNSKIIKNKIINIGLSFDHSFLNASMAINFLDNLSSEIEAIINEY